MSRYAFFYQTAIYSTSLILLFKKFVKQTLLLVKGVYAIITYPLSILKLLVSNTLWFLASYKQSVIQLHVTCIGN